MVSSHLIEWGVFVVAVIALIAGTYAFVGIGYAMQDTRGLRRVGAVVLGLVGLAVALFAGLTLFALTGGN